MMSCSRCKTSTTEDIPANTSLLQLGYLLLMPHIFMASVRAIVAEKRVFVEHALLIATYLQKV